MLTFGLSTQVTAQQETVAAPENRILDKANLLRERPELLAELTASLNSIQEKHGYSVYLAVYHNVLEGSVKSRADALYQSWLGEEKRGLVLVIQLDPAVDGKRIAASYYRTSGLEEDAALKLIPDQEMKGLVSRAIKSVGADGEGRYDATRVSSLAFAIEQGIGDYYAVEPARWSDAGNLKIMAIFLSVIILVGILGALLWRRFTSVDVKSNHCYHFPEVEVAQRLGAPYGGGWVSEASFVPASSRK